MMSMDGTMMDDDMEYSRSNVRSRSTTENLHRSIHLLEEAVGTGKRLSHRPSHTFSPMSRGISLQNTSSQDRASTSILGNTSIAVDFTSNITMLLNDDPGLSASSSVFTDFMQCLHSYPRDHQIFDLLDNYKVVCNEQVTLLRSLVKSAAPHQQKFTQTVNTLNLLEQEGHTWTLIHSLFKDKFESDLDNDSHMDILDSLDKYRSDRDLVDSLYKRDHSVTQAQLVVDWLEHMAGEACDRYDENLAYFLDKAVAWENTLHKLERKKTNLSMGGRRLIDEMDPDAPFRQTGHLDDLDKEDEARLLKYMFVCVRAGQIDKAQEMCVQCGQPWRAATLEGWRLPHDPNHNLVSGGVLGVVEGNHLRDVWKMVCWTMAADPKVSQYEKAIYGSRSGHLSSMLAVCHTWQDYLWANFRALVDHKVEMEIRENYRGARTLQELPASYSQTQLQPEKIFRDIEACENETVMRESKEWFAVIQKHIILMNFDDLIEVFYNWVQTYKDQIPKHLLRFIVHLVLFLRRIGHTPKDELFPPVLELYIRSLIDDDNVDLVATYVRSLPADAQVVWYAMFLQGISNEDRRQHCLQLAHQSHLNVHAITKRVVNIIRNDGQSFMDVSRLDQAITENERDQINAVDWLMFDPLQRGEAIIEANTFMRLFIAAKKTSACREVMDKITADSITIIKNNCQRQTGTDVLPPRLDSAVREHMAIRAYLDAMDEFNVWFNYFHHNKPSEPNHAPSSTFTEQVAYEHRQKQYNMEVERWKHTLTQHTQNSKERIYNVLLFPHGWMTNIHELGDNEENRLLQMSRLRQLCLPNMCVLLHTVLHSTQNYRECIQLANIIANDDRQLYKEFEKSDLHKLLELLQQSSLSLLDTTSDPLGYPAT